MGPENLSRKILSIVSSESPAPSYKKVSSHLTSWVFFRIMLLKMLSFPLDQNLNISLKRGHSKISTLVRYRVNKVIIRTSQIYYLLTSKNLAMTVIYVQINFTCFDTKLFVQNFKTKISYLISILTKRISCISKTFVN